jgi:hypothetical protein
MKLGENPASPLLDECARLIGPLSPSARRDKTAVLAYLDEYETLVQLEWLERRQSYWRRKDALLHEILSPADYQAWSFEKRGPLNARIRKRKALIERAQAATRARRDDADTRRKILEHFGRLTKGRARTPETGESSRASSVARRNMFGE